ncbi:hypothetical protein [Micromonospora sp. NPDC003241]
MGWVLVAALLSTVTACDGTPSPSPSDAPSGQVATTATPTDFAAPPLRLPTVATGDACPVTEPQPWPHPDQASRVLGPGPLYPVADYFRDGVLELRAMDRQQDGTYTKKVRWIGSGYAGPVLVRAARIDGTGPAGAEFAYLGEPRDGGHHALLVRPENDLPATTMVGGPGCYAYQVDGTTFSVTVVFRAALETTSDPSS